MLSRIDLQGFKTFSARTTLELEPGITAIVGPNGSGKSNLADAIRWVLGEQSLRAIRSRKTEDVIFAGSPGRPPAGMAEVIVTFDNRDGRFSLPYSELSITRRAYRSGENEYAINRERSRYRDVSDLLSRASLSPNGHVVIGQGLADAALSLRPEERRAFIDDAAGISAYQTKLAGARERLAQTEANVLRASDLLGEIAARLPDLRLRAARAREVVEAQRELQHALLGWHAIQWHLHSTSARSLAETAVESAGLLRTARVQLDRLRETQRALASDHLAALSALDEERKRKDDLASRVEVARRTATGLRERLAGLKARSDDSEREVASLRERLRVEESASTVDIAARADCALRLATLHDALAAADAASHERTTRRRETVERVQTLERQVTSVSGRLAANRASQEAVERRREALSARLRELARAMAEGDLSARALEARHLAADSEVRRLEGETREATTAIRLAEAALAEASRARDERVTCQRELERSVESLQGRRDLLQGWHDSLTVYYSGVKAVLRAARTAKERDRLAGVVGPVAELVRVPPNLEVAIETALGGHLQDVVVERWPDAEAAIQMLKRTGAGRATFLPLDTLRVSSRPTPRLAESDVLGVACDLVGFDARYSLVVRHLLGQTLVVTDLTAARRVLASLQGGWQIVTTGGEIVRSSGAVTGGSDRGGGSGVLARERELRDSPADLARARQSLDVASAEVASAMEHERAAETELARLRRTEHEVVLARRSADVVLQSILRDEAIAEHGSRSRARESERAAAELGQLNAETKALTSTHERLASEHVRLQVELRAASQLIADLDESDRAESRQFAETRAAQGSCEQEIRALDRSLERHSLAVRGIHQQIAERSQHLRQLTEGATAAAAQISGEEEALARSEVSLRMAKDREQALASSCSRLSDRRQGIDSEAESAVRQADDLSRRTSEDERVANRAAAELDSLRRQIEHDLGPSEIAGHALSVTIEGQSVPLALPSEPQVDLASRVAELRRRSRTLGPANPELIEECDRTVERHAFLQAQVRDLEAGSGSIRDAIAELETAIRVRFDEAFAVMRESFARNFTTLFGGGVGRLVLTDPASPESTGIDVVAAVPGRRVRDLAQLSGGERALTAVALIFAVLEANPTPVCVLDEVDAALDDANVGRFCALLRERSALTQFVVITHNRRTMESAAALYGITMEDRATSRVLSLRLTGVPR